MSHVSLFRWLTLLAVVCLLESAPGRAGAEQVPTQFHVLVGTYTQGSKSKGIYQFTLDVETGKASGALLVGEVESPSFLAIHPTQKYVYAVQETASFQGTKSGGVSAFARDGGTGKLTLLNDKTSSGAHPCHLVVDKTGKFVLVANYTGGSVSVLPILPDGKLGEPTAVVQHKGSSVNKGRQEAPHAHAINLDRDNRFAVVADLGLDKLLVYKFDASKGTLTPNEPPALDSGPGAGPRHFAFHPDGKRAFVINELDSTLTALTYDPQKGVLTKGATVSTLPKDFKGKNSTAEVVVHPSGAWVYGSNRGHNSIAGFSAHDLTPLGHQTHQIKTPRNFVIDPTGKTLLVASQDGNQVIVFRINNKTGELTPTGSVVDVPRPVCLRMIAK